MHDRDPRQEFKPRSAPEQLEQPNPEAAGGTEIDFGGHVSDPELRQVREALRLTRSIDILDILEEQRRYTPSWFGSDYKFSEYYRRWLRGRRNA